MKSDWIKFTLNWKNLVQTKFNQVKLKKIQLNRIRLN